MNLLLACVLGILLGVRHTLEPDHLAAVATLVTRKGSARAGMRVGALWGLGHSTGLLLVGTALVLLRAELPLWLGELFEGVVAVMLVGLGIRAIAQAARLGKDGGAVRAHQHGEQVHSHGGADDHVHLFGRSWARGPLLVGMVHGLAGSGALTALAFASMPTAASRLVYMGLFGIGSVGGMALLAGLAGLPLQRIARHPRVALGVLHLSGAASVVLGLVWLWGPAAHLLA